jgi:hypothetical protein
MRCGFERTERAEPLTVGLSRNPLANPHIKCVCVFSGHPAVEQELFAYELYRLVLGENEGGLALEHLLRPCSSKPPQLRRIRRENSRILPREYAQFDVPADLIIGHAEDVEVRVEVSRIQLQPVEWVALAC